MTGTFAQPATLQRNTLNTDSETVFSDAEKRDIMDRLTTITSTSRPRSGLESYKSYMIPLTKQIAQLRLDNETMCMLAPEIKTAETIVIPSIMSPTDLKDGTITLLSTSKLLDDATNLRISELLDAHFNAGMGLSIKLQEWIREALYGAGSKPIMVLPISELDTVINDPTAVQYTTTQTDYAATEALRIRNKLLNIDTVEAISIFDMADTKVAKDIKTPQAAIEALKPDLETAVTKFVKAHGDEIRESDSYNFKDKFKESAQKDFAKLVVSALNSITMVDNPDVMKVDKARKADTKAKIQQRIVTHYKPKTMVSLGADVGVDKGNPVMYELPPESVIPIYTPGTPTDHIGYFIMLDEFGNPLQISEDMGMDDANNSSRLDATSFYKAMGLDGYFNRNSSQAKRDELMADIYQSIIQNHLKSRLKSGGFENLDIGTPEPVYRCLFARYLAARKTKMLFVPKDFVTYFCFNYNSNGTGRSQIEGIKFTLSLKITLLICRMMAAMNSAINRKTISVQFDEKMGDPVQYIELLKKEAIEKSIVNFSYDPADITRSLAQRAISVKAKGIPGAENFDISTEPNEVRDIKPDEGLAQDIDNLMILGLDTPPSAMNMLSENEFSRSVATNNLFFSRRISAKQAVTCKHVGNYIRTYVRFSEVLKTKITEIIHQGGAKQAENTAEDAGTAEDKSVSNAAMLDDIINNIKASLPSPDIAPNKTEFEELDAVIQSMSTALEGIFDNDLASDDPIPVIRSIVKSDLIRELMDRIGVSKGLAIPNLDAGFLNRIMEFRQQLLNTSKGLTELKVKTTPPSDETDSATTGGAPNF